MALNIVERTAKLSTVRPGMLLRLQYTTGVYVIFVVNPNRPNAQTGKFQLHGYKLNATTTESDLINILVNLNAGLVVDSVNKELRTTEITDTEAYEARYILRGVDSRPYRTFNIENVVSVTQLSFELPPILDTILRGNVVITSKSSKRQLLTCAQSGDDECIQNIPEIREQMIAKKRTREETALEEAAERENQGGASARIRARSARNILNSIQQFVRGK